MKKWFLVLGMITCIFGFTACGRQEEEAELLTTQEAEQFAENLLSVIDQVVSQNSESEELAYLKQAGMDPAVFEQAFASWKNASEDMGNYVEMIGVTDNSMIVEEYSGSRYPIEGVISVRIKGEQRDAIVEIVYEDSQPASISTNVEYSLGEKMEKAWLNTLLGMGTVFIVLILISLIIGCFGFIPKIQAKFTKKHAKEEVREAAVDNAIAQIIENEELSDDTELVAVIAAAIAASEGASGTEGFVVRSIRRAGNKWQRA